MTGKTHSKHALSSGQRRPLLLAAAISAVLVTSHFARPVFAANAPATAPAPLELSATMPSSFADLIDAVKPAVVNISVSGKSANPSAGPMRRFEVPPGSPFEDFFERFFEDRSAPGGGPEHGFKAQSMGSGFIIDESGYIVTNNHVIDGADEITVVLTDGATYPARVAGHDEKTDLALLKVEADGPLPYVSFGDSDEARVGDWVVAIGNPFGLGGTATTGTISARGRDINAGPFDDFLQVEAPINRGNSGGPLFDTAGRVIGVNTAIYSPNGGSVGIGFAIPASLAKSVVEQLRENGAVERGWLGVQIQEVTEDIAAGLGLDESEGALVASVVPNSPAAAAGVMPGDVIMRFDGHTIARLKDLTRLVAETEANESAKVEVWRDGGKRTLMTVIAKMPADDRLAAGDDDNGKAGVNGKGKLGLSLASITPEARAEFGLGADVEGVLVVGVRENSPAASKGLRAGDVIGMVGQNKVSTPEDVIEAVAAAAEAEREAVLLRVSRGGGEQFVAVSLA